MKLMLVMLLLTTCAAPKPAPEKPKVQILELYGRSVDSGKPTPTE